jgi:hypothetical protein
MNKKDVFMISINKEDVRQIVNEQIELHESKGRKYGYLGLCIFLSTYMFLLYLIVAKQ